MFAGSEMPKASHSCSIRTDNMTPRRKMPARIVQTTGAWITLHTANETSDLPISGHSVQKTHHRQRRKVSV